MNTFQFGSYYINIINGLCYIHSVYDESRPNVHVEPSFEQAKLYIRSKEDENL